jgi:hypothetical protein
MRMGAREAEFHTHSQATRCGKHIVVSELALVELTLAAGMHSVAIISHMLSCANSKRTPPLCLSPDYNLRTGASFCRFARSFRRERAIGRLPNLSFFANLRAPAQPAQYKRFTH